MPRVFGDEVTPSSELKFQIAIVLEMALGTSTEMWARVQAEYDLWAVWLRAA